LIASSNAAPAVAGTDDRELLSEANSRILALSQFVWFVCEHPWRILGISLAVLVPCFWQRHLEAGDLGSHLYNAWLAQLIERGQAPGLWIARQWNNVLFDFLVGSLASVFSLRVAGRIAVAMSVLIFFWGAFALACAAMRRAPWFLVPLLAMISYGWTFEMGFLNYYLSLGFAFWGLALFWRGVGWERIAFFAFAPLALPAHPLGFLWLLAAAAYIGIASAIPRRYQIALFLLAALTLVLLHFYLAHHYVMDPPDLPYRFFTGADQFVLFGSKYNVIKVSAILFVLAAFGAELLQRRSAARDEPGYAIPLQLYLLAELGVVLLPDGIHLPQYPAAVALLTERLTAVSAVLACCVLAAIRPRRWHWIGFGALALISFGFLYRDTAAIDKMETQVERLVVELPPNSRVMATILPFPGSRVVMQHIVDRACIGHCFSYGNYEPASGQFRVRALPGNPYVMTNDRDTAAMEEGWYEVQPRDLPVYQIYQCSLTGNDLCIAPLAAGDGNDDRGVHPK
jgi:hypothetical protein